MLFAQIAPPPATPSGGTAGVVEVAPPAGGPVAPPAPVLPPAVDTRTTKDASFDTPPPPDARTTRDSGYDPRLEAQKEEERRREEAARSNRDFAGVPTVRSSRAIAEENGTLFLPGGTDYIAQLAIIQGYNTNVVQTQDVLGGPIAKHPSPFTGVDAELAIRTWTSSTDPHEIRFDVRGQHYEPLENYKEPDDGAFVASYAGQYTLDARTVATFRAMSTIATLNSSRLSDGPVFLVEPASLQRTYTLSSVRVALTHEITSRLRYTQGVDATLGTTIRDSPIQLADGSFVFHHGVDFLQPGTDGTLFYDISDIDIFFGRARYEQIRNYFLLDFTQTPPRYLGVATTHVGELATGISHQFSDAFRSTTTGGLIVATPPPLDPDTRPIISPLVIEELLLQKQYWLFNLAGTYTYGSTSPRLGFGPVVSGVANLSGIPFPHSTAGRKLAVLGNANVTRAVFSAGATENGQEILSRITYYIASIEARYALNTWLGLLGGYSYRYVVFEGANATPSLERHIVFLGLSGYWATDRSLPTINTFTAPTTL
jgi:hypothetical protein